ncbi:hypothetical protein [Mycobacterium sp. DL592]|uniref:hypothetical protein n=1 Tax=Mycobacterium sp. DL592 TaxID=2675524 RepID=UPI0014233AB0|nr:hypothetical protein [Mycobacterium sp. DL592]
MATTAALVGRIGGLAVALGIGAAIGTALASSASADSPSAGSEHAASATGGAGPRSGATAHASRPASSGAAVSARVVRTAAAPVHRSLPPTTTVDPIRLPLLGTETIPWPSTNVPDGTGIKATPPTPVKVHVGFKGQIAIFQNLPFSLPRLPAFFVTKVSGSAMLTDNTVYDLHNVDQYDWNKLTGISFNILRPDQNALMVAWRYNVNAKQFEIAPYYNVDLARILPTQSEIIPVPIGQTFTFSVDYNGITVSYANSSVFKPIPADLHPNQLTAFRVQTWFGGTSLPPRSLTLYMNLN